VTQRFPRPMLSPFVALLLLAPFAIAQEIEVAAPVADVAPSLAGPADEGRFTLYVNEEPLIEIRHRWEESGAYSSEMVLSMAGQTVETKYEVEVDEDGRWVRMKIEVPARTVRYERSESEVSIVTSTDDEATVELKPGTLLYDNYQPAWLRQLAAAYDREAGGEQIFPLLFTQGVVFEVTAERLESRERTVTGRDLVFERFDVMLVDVAVELWVDDEGRVVLIDVPAQHAAYVREGYEALRSTDTEDAVSRPEHGWKLVDELMVPMRDDVKLATDLYLPDAEGPFPLILVRTPYMKEMLELQGKFYARRGYAYAVQDCRGRFASEGVWAPFFAEPADGHDSIEWLAAQEWCNGMVGMIGGSYVGWVQWWAARERPDHLVTIIPNVAPPDPFFNIPYEYGCFFLLGAIWWADVLEQEATADLTGVAMEKICEKDYLERLKHLPVIELDEKVLGERNEYWRDWIEHPVNDEWWDRASFLEHLEGLDIPVFHQSGWFDGDGIGSKLNYAAMRRNGASLQKLVLGPWGHTDTATRAVGGEDFGPSAVVDLQREYLRWFDHFLRGVDNGIETEPLVSLFVMGSNRWIEGDEYPLPETVMERWYLRGEGNANTSAGDGSLSTEAPGADESADEYVYDPGDPTPSPQMAEDEKDDEAGEADEAGSDEEREGLTGYERTLAERGDILVYRSEPLAEPLVFAGPITAVLYASSSAKDTDWFVRLSVLDEEGELYTLVEGKIRARFRRSCSEPVLLEPGEIHEYTIDCWQTAFELPAGARIQVEVASASFPMFSRNLNTGGHNEMETEHVPATQTIHHDAAHPSHVVLPVIPAKR